MSFLFSALSEKYLKGKVDGGLDFQNKKTRNPTTLLDAISRLFWSEKEYEDYVRGYIEGYDDAYDDAHFLLYSEIKKNNITPNSFKKQIELLEALKEGLNNFALQLEEDSKEYERRIMDIAVSNGLVEEMYDEFLKCSLAPTQAKIAAMVEQIKVRDIALVNKEIDFFQRFKTKI